MYHVAFVYGEMLKAGRKNGEMKENMPYMYLKRGVENF